MGAGASSGGSKPAGSGAAKRGTHSKGATAVKESPVYPIKPLSENIMDLPYNCLLRVDPEALVIVDSGTMAVLKSYPYHQIPCWGHTREAFQFRCFAAGATKMETIVVGTGKGVQLETVIMATVRGLMRDMKDKGMPEVQFKQLMAVIEEDSDGALNAVRQAAASREFDIKQACKIVRTVGELSPFDKIEAAVLMYPTIMNKDSFTLVLKEFEDEADRDNICHRLGITVDPDGHITEHGKRNAAREKPAGEGGGGGTTPAPAPASASAEAAPAAGAAGGAGPAS